jgi:hypothetical protein
MSIFDLITSQELSAYWLELTQDKESFIGEELFPDNQKRGIDLKWIKGVKGLPVVLKTSAFDVAAIPRTRIGFDKLMTSMPFFKESIYVDEELRQELNLVLETGNQAYIDSVMTKVFDDEIRLIESAAVSRERMRMQCITTGIVAMSANGQAFVYDYGVPESHKGNPVVAWADYANADPLEDIRVARDLIYDETGTTVTRAICNTFTWRKLRNNDFIKKAIFVLTNGVGALTDSQLAEYISNQVDIDIVINDKRYVDETGATNRYVGDDIFVLLPPQTLGNTWFGTTPEQSDLMTSAIANVSIVDTGVAITTIEESDPVNVQTKVTQVCLPSFEAADEIYIMDVSVAAV